MNIFIAPTIGIAGFLCSLCGSNTAIIAIVGLIGFVNCAMTGYTLGMRHATEIFSR